MKKTSFKTLTILASLFMVASCNPQPAPHVHTFSSDWSHNDQMHWHDATCGHDVKDSEAAHTWGEWIIDREAAPEADGLKHHVCNVCEHSVSEAIKYKSQVDAYRIYLDKADISLLTSYDYTLKPVVFPEGSFKNVKYDIEDTTVVSISNDKAFALKEGKSIVKAYNDNNDNSVLDEDEPYAVICFTIKDPVSGTYFEIKNPSINLEVGDQGKIEFEVHSTIGKPSGLDYGYYSSNEEVCTISAGKIKAHKPGTSQVSVTWKGYRGLATVTVTDKTDSTGLRCSSIEVDNAVVTASKGETKKINISLLPSGTVDTVASVSSNNESVATCDTSGNLNLKAKGSALLTIKTTNNVIKRAKVVVTDSSVNDNDSYYNNYYGDLTWENGDDLKEKLHNIISSNVTALRYDTPNWETNQYADEYFYDPNYVEVVYSVDPFGKDAHGTSGTVWQREHAFAASLMTGFSTGVAVTNYGRATDFHNLFAANGGANGSRGNKNFGYADPNSAEYSIPEKASDVAFVRKAFEPSDTDKGRLARAIFYMGVMYNTVENASVKEKWTFKGPDVETHDTKSTTVNLASKEQALEIVENVVDYNKISLDNFMYTEAEETQNLVNYYRALALQLDPSLVEGSDAHRQKAYSLYNDASMPYAIGNLSSLLEWNTFSPDLYEMQHNESVYSHNSVAGKGTQGNRNPFVDYPELVDYVYGPLKDQPGSLKNLIPSYKSLEMDKDEIHHYSVDSSVNPSFAVGDSFSLDKVNNIKAIKNDLSEGTLDKSKLSYAAYTFVDGDASNGKDIAITSDKNNFVIHCNVTGGGGGGGDTDDTTFDNAAYHFETSSKPADLVRDGIASFGDLSWTFETENDVTLSSYNGLKIGAAGSGAGTVTLETTTSLNNVSKVFFKVYCPKNSEYKYDIFVNGVAIVTNGSLTKDTAVITEYSAQVNPNATGKVKIVFKNVTASYISLKGLAINYAA